MNTVLDKQAIGSLLIRLLEFNAVDLFFRTRIKLGRELPSNYLFQAETKRNSSAYCF